MIKGTFSFVFFFVSLRIGKFLRIEKNICGTPKMTELGNLLLTYIDNNFLVGLRMSSES